jgi:hypothetical protein
MFPSGWPGSSQALVGLGYGQTWQDVSSKRVVTTTYYNTTGKPIQVQLWGTASATAITMQLSVNGIAVDANANAATYACPVKAIVPIGGTYSATQTGTTFTLNKWVELR